MSIKLSVYLSHCLCLSIYLTICLSHPAVATLQMIHFKSCSPSMFDHGAWNDSFLLFDSSTYFNFRYSICYNMSVWCRVMQLEDLIVSARDQWDSDASHNQRGHAEEPDSTVKGKSSIMEEQEVEHNVIGKSSSFFAHTSLLASDVKLPSLSLYSLIISLFLSALPNIRICDPRHQSDSEMDRNAAKECSCPSVSIPGTELLLASFIWDNRPCQCFTWVCVHIGSLFVCEPLHYEASKYSSQTTGAFYRANTIMREGNDTKPGLLSQASMSAAEAMFDTFRG